MRASVMAKTSMSSDLWNTLPLYAIVSITWRLNQRFELTARCMEGSGAGNRCDRGRTNGCRDCSSGRTEWLFCVAVGHRYRTRRSCKGSNFRRLAPSRGPRKARGNICAGRRRQDNADHWLRRVPRSFTCDRSGNGTRSRQGLYIFKEVAPFLSDLAILASNTSSIPITRLVAHSSDPSRFVGLHFFNPVPFMGLIEIIPGMLTGEDTVESVVRFAEALQKQPILSQTNRVSSSTASCSQ